MSEMVGQDMITGMGFIGTEPGMYRMTPTYTYGEAEGTAISVASKGGPFKGMRVMGRTEQKRTTGAQLFDASKLVPRNSGTAEIRENGRVIAVTGKSAYCGVQIHGENISMFDNLIGKDAFLSAKFRGNTLNANVLIAITYRNKDDDAIMYFASSSSLSGGTLFHSRLIPDGATILNLQVTVNHSSTTLDKEQTVIFEDLIIGVGTTALHWEPYTGGIPSPSPDYPQELVSVGDGGSVEVEVRGRNLFAGNIVGGYLSNIDGNIAGESESLNVVVALKTFIPIVRSEVVAVIDGYTPDMKNAFAYRIGMYDENKVWIKNYGLTKEKTIITLPKEAKYVRFSAGRIGKMAVYFDDTDLYVNPVYQSLTIATPNGLPGIPVTSGGNYTDQNGQQWICDEVDLERGVKVQRIYRDVLDGSKPYVKSSSSNENGTPFACPTTQQVKGYNKGALSLCNNRTFYIGGIPNIKDYEFCVFGAAKSYVGFCSATATTVDEFKAEMDANPAIILCALETPIETPLTDEEIAAYRALHTNKPVTTITNSDNAHMIIKFKKER